MKDDNPAAALQKLVTQGVITQDTSDTLRTWLQTNKVSDIEEVASFRQNDGSKVTRYRLKGTSSEDLLIDVVTAQNGEVTISSVQTTPSDKTSPIATSDSLTVAEGFMEAVRQGDMVTARSLVTGTEVSDATVAGLCMVFEEGDFKLRSETPFRNTFLNPEHAGYLVYVVTADNPKHCNIGLEMSKVEPGWRVSGVPWIVY